MMTNHCRILRMASSRWLRLVLLLASLNSFAYGQAPTGVTAKRARTPADYEARSLKQLAGRQTTDNGKGNKAETLWVYSDLLPSRVRATYTGAKRSAPGIKKEVVHQWARLYAGFPEGFTRPYQTEMRFVEDGKEYWLAVRTNSLAPFKKAFRRGDVVDVYLVHVGRAITARAWEPVLLVEDLQKAK